MSHRELPTMTSLYTSQAFTCSCWMWLNTLCHHFLVFFPVWSLFLASLFQVHANGWLFLSPILPKKTSDPLVVRCLCAAPLLPALVFWLPMLSQLSDCSAFTRVFDNNILHNKSIALVYIYEHERNANIHIYMVMKGLKPFIDHLPLNMIMCILLYRSFLIQSRISTSVSFSSY